MSPADLRQIERTVRRTPEVMVKVLRHGGTDRGAVQRHFDYLSRKGELDIETDDGQVLSGREAFKGLLSDWDLDIEESRPRSALVVGSRVATPKLAHKLIFSMPAGTPPDKVLDATRAFCRKRFAFDHRYAMVLHTDEPHPHVHVVLKAVSEKGERLNIRKAHLRAWRAEFAAQLRALGVAANATDRAARGVSGLRKRDPIYRAMTRAASTHLSALLDALVRAPEVQRRRAIAGAEKLEATRKEVEHGWQAVARQLEREGRAALAAEVRSFATQLKPPRTDQEILATQLTSGTSRAGPQGGANEVRPVPERSK